MTEHEGTMRKIAEQLFKTDFESFAYDVNAYRGEVIELKPRVGRRRALTFTETFDALTAEYMYDRGFVNLSSITGAIRFTKGTNEVTTWKPDVGEENWGMPFARGEIKGEEAKPEEIDRWSPLILEAFWKATMDRHAEK